MLYKDLIEANIVWLNEYLMFGKHTYPNGIGSSEIAFIYEGQLMLAEGCINDAMDEWSVRAIKPDQLPDFWQWDYENYMSTTLKDSYWDWYSEWLERVARWD